MAQPPGRSRSATRLRERLAGYDEVAVAVVLFVAFLILRARIDVFVPGGRGRTFIESDAWPGAILTAAVVLSAAYVVQTVRRARGAEALMPEATLVGPTAEEAPALQVDTGNGHQPRQLAAGFALLLGYIWVMPTIGFVPATVLFCVALPLLLGERRWWLIVGIPAAVTTLVLMIFTRLLVVPLPRGRGIFLELSTYLY